MVAKRHKITNVPLFKKIWDIIFFFGTITFWAISRDILRGPRLFWPLKCPSLRSGQFKGSKKSWPPQNVLETAQKVIVPQKKNYVPHFLKQRDINSYLFPFITWFHGTVFTTTSALFSVFGTSEYCTCRYLIKRRFMFFVAFSFAMASIFAECANMIQLKNNFFSV